MKKILFFLTVLATVLGMQSCSNADEPQIAAGTQERDYEVVYVGDLSTPTTRANVDATQTSEQILKFKDQAAYDRTLASVKAMDGAARLEFFNKIGFDGAYTLLNKADEELDKAFDLAETTDSISGVAIIRECVEKYSGILTFNETDPSDVTPSLPFVDEKAELLGNKNGYVMVGDNLIAPKAAAPGPVYNGSFIKYGAEVKVKNGKYTSYFRLGRIGVNMAFQLETYRRILGIKKSDKNCCYDGNLEIYSNGKSEKAIIHNGKGNWKLYSLASAYTPRVNMKMTNFSSTRNNNNKVSKTITNILVK